MLVGRNDIDMHEGFEDGGFGFFVSLSDGLTGRNFSANGLESAFGIGRDFDDFYPNVYHFESVGSITHCIPCPRQCGAKHVLFNEGVIFCEEKFANFTFSSFETFDPYSDFSID